MYIPLLSFLFFTEVFAKSISKNQKREDRPPIILSRTGGFQIGGKVLTNPANPNETLSCDHGYIEYFIPINPRQTTLLMWHSSSTQVFQNVKLGRWTRYKDLFLSRQYPVLLWDGPRVGRANWGCVPQTYTPAYRDQSNFPGWNFGPSFENWWPDVQFPIEDREKRWKEATRARYDEMDTDENVLLYAETMATAIDSGKLGKNIVFLTNSAAGLGALLATSMAGSGNVKGVVTYESIGYVFPTNTSGIKANEVPGFGPFVVNEGDFDRLAKLKGVQFVWGDHRSENNTYVVQSRRVAGLINERGGNAEVLMLGEKGLKGSTHIAFADEDNERVAGLLDEFLEGSGLDEFAEDDWDGGM